MRHLIGLLLTFIALVAATAVEPAAFPLRASADGLRLVDQNGKPFLYQADTPWRLVSLPPADMDQYLSVRDTQGFTALQVMVTNFQLFSPSWAGNRPFLANDLSRPNPAYFADFDVLVAKASARGFALMLAPLWFGYNQDTYYPYVNDANAYALGRFLGQRYGGKPNVLWMLGGDSDPGPKISSVRAMAQGLRDGGANQLMTYHADYRSMSSSTFFSGDGWYGINGVYGGYIPPGPYTGVLDDYNKTPHRPAILLECQYEGNNNVRGGAGAAPQQIRRQAWWTMLSGGAGHAYGCRDMWDFTASWREKLTAPGAVHLGHLPRLLRQYQWSRLVPDQSHTLLVDGYLGYGSDDYATAARADDGSFAMIYAPWARTLKVDLGRIGPSVRARWYDPTSGSWTTLSGSPFAGAVRSFAMPAGNNAGDSDQVLVLDRDATPPTATAAFVRADASTAGNWVGAYGADGYVIPSSTSSAPSYASVSVSGHALWTWDPAPTSTRAPWTSPARTGRIASCWYSGGGFTIDCDLTDGATHQVALYGVDWDGNNSRADTIQVLDAGTGAVLDTRVLSAFSAGIYQVWNIKGHVQFRVTSTGAVNAVISGVFFGGGGVTPPAGLVRNPGFEDDGKDIQSPSGWSTWAGTNGTDGNADYTEAYGGAHGGTWHGTHWRTTAYEVFTYQVVTGLADGSYTLSSWVRSTGGQTYAWMEANGYGGAKSTANIPATNTWTRITIPGIQVTNGQCTIGFYSRASGGQWIYFDDVQFAAAVAPPPPTSAIGIDLAGGAVTIEGEAWRSYSTALASGLSVANGTAWSGTYPAQLSPTPDADTQAMLQSGVYRLAPPNGQGFALAQTVANGTYDVWVWTLENYRSNFRDMDLKLEGTTVATGIGDLPLWTWRKYGPYQVTVNDGVLNLDVLRRSKGDPALYGLLIAPATAAAPAMPIGTG